MAEGVVALKPAEVVGRGPIAQAIGVAVGIWSASRMRKLSSRLLTLAARLAAASPPARRWPRGRSINSFALPLARYSTNPRICPTISSTWSSLSLLREPMGWGRAPRAFQSKDLIWWQST